MITKSTAKSSFLISSVDKIIDDVDLILDFQSNKEVQKCLKKNLKKKGTFIEVGFSEPITYKSILPIGFNKLKSHIFSKVPILFSLKSNQEDLKFLAQEIEKGKLNFKNEYKVFPLEKVNEAMELKNKTREKIIIKV
jgi:NADPH:quinone reductase-like Zn-dependent oxidoreductase